MNGNYAAAAATAATATFSAAAAAAAKMTAKTTYAFPLGSRDVFRLHSSTQRMYVRVCVCELCVSVRAASRMLAATSVRACVCVCLTANVIATPVKRK